MTDFVKLVITLTVVFGGFGLFIIWMSYSKRGRGDNDQPPETPRDNHNNESMVEHRS